MGYQVALLVWGEAYTDLFLRISLPTQLSPRNLPALSDLGRSKYTIYSTAADLVKIRGSASFRTLTSIMPVDLVTMDPAEIARHNNYDVMKATHCEAIRRANAMDQPLIFSGPDAIFSDGTMATVDRLVREGKRAVMIPSYRVAKESYLAAFEERYPQDKKGVIAAPPRELVGMSLTRLHPLSQAFLWDSADYHRMPAHMYWRVPSPPPEVGSGKSSDASANKTSGEISGGASGGTSGGTSGGGEGLLLRCFHIHPIMVWPNDKAVLPLMTIDNKYVSQACPRWEDIHTVDDSDDMFIPELSNTEHELLMQPVLTNGSRYLDFLKLSTSLRNDMSMKAVAVAHWALQFTDEYHRRYVKVKHRCHTGRRTPEAWAKVEAESDRMLAQIEEWFVGNVTIKLPELFNVVPQDRIRVGIRVGPPGGTATPAAGGKAEAAAVVGAA